MVAELISVGTELLLGQTVDTNAAFISQELAKIGVDVYFRSTVGDNRERLRAALKLALGRADAVIVTGGLGPTADDLTRDVVAEVVGCDLRVDEPARQKMLERLQGRGIPVRPDHLRQAMVPSRGRALLNPRGTAAGLMVESDGRLILAVPGVPGEMRAMFLEEVLPDLRGRAGGQVLVSRTLRLVGIGESSATERITDLLEAQTNPTVAPLVGDGEVRLRITAKASGSEEAQEMIEAIERQIRQRLGDHIFGADEETLEAHLIHRLREAGLTLGVAESCTGGLISHRLTNVSGSSECFLGSVVSYSNSLKIDWIGVPEEWIEQYGAVSAPTAEAMAQGIRKLCRSHLGISATGIAGPTGGSPEKPVGLVYVGLGSDAGTVSECHRFGNDRHENKQRAAQAALWLLKRYLDGKLELAG